MGQFISPSIIRYSYKDVQEFIKRTQDNILLINTLDTSNQTCLIKNTIHANDEERIINQFIRKNTQITICIYGKHTCDDSVYKKYQQLKELGFSNVGIYIGGLFEWLCLQDIYSDAFFPTTNKVIEILNYSPPNRINM